MCGLEDEKCQVKRERMKDVTHNRKLVISFMVQVSHKSKERFILNVRQVSEKQKGKMSSLNLLCVKAID